MLQLFLRWTMNADETKQVIKSLKTFLDARKTRAIDLFREFDEDCSGSISYTELRQGLENHGFVLTRESWLGVCEAFDQDSDGNVDYRELARELAAMAKIKDAADQDSFEAQMRAARSAWRRDNSDRLTLSRLCKRRPTMASAGLTKLPPGPTKAVAPRLTWGPKLNERRAERKKRKRDRRRGTRSAASGRGEAYREPEHSLSLPNLARWRNERPRVPSKERDAERISAARTHSDSATNVTAVPESRSDIRQRIHSAAATSASAEKTSRALASSVRYKRLPGRVVETYCNTATGAEGTRRSSNAVSGSGKGINRRRRKRPRPRHDPDSKNTLTYQPYSTPCDGPLPNTIASAAEECNDERETINIYGANTKAVDSVDLELEPRTLTEALKPRPPAPQSVHRDAKDAAGQEPEDALSQIGSKVEASSEASEEEEELYGEDDFEDDEEGYGEDDFEDETSVSPTKSVENRRDATSDVATNADATTESSGPLLDGTKGDPIGVAEEEEGARAVSVNSASYTERCPNVIDPEFSRDATEDQMLAPLIPPELRRSRRAGRAGRDDVSRIFMACSARIQHVAATSAAAYRAKMDAASLDASHALANVHAGTVTSEVFSGCGAPRLPEGGFDLNASIAATRRAAAAAALLQPHARPIPERRRQHRRRKVPQRRVKQHQALSKRRADAKLKSTYGGVTAVSRIEGLPMSRSHAPFHHRTAPLRLSLDKKAREKMVRDQRLKLSRLKL